MVGTRVVDHLVLDDLDPVAVSRVDQRAQRGEVPEVYVHRVEVHGPVAVVVRDRPPGLGLPLVQAIAVIVDRRYPQHRDAEVPRVGQAGLEAREVAAVVAPRPGAVVQAARDGRVVVGRVPVREAVRHDEVDHVAGAEALEAPAALERRGHLETGLDLAGEG
jgi:hypothetical protein